MNQSSSKVLTEQRQRLQEFQTFSEVDTLHLSFVFWLLSSRCSAPDFEFTFDFPPHLPSVPNTESGATTTTRMPTATPEDATATLKDVCTPSNSNL